MSYFSNNEEHISSGGGGLVTRFSVFAICHDCSEFQLQDKSFHLHAPSATPAELLAAYMFDEDTCIN